MPYLGRAPTGTGSVTEIDGDLKITGQLTAQDTLFKMILDGTDGSSTNASDNIIIEDGGTDGSGTDAGDDICTEKDTGNKIDASNINLSDDFAFSGTVTGTPSPGLNFISKHTASDGDSYLTLDNVFDSTYDNYLLVGTLWQNNTDNTQLRLQVKTTAFNTDSVYDSQMVGITTGGVSHMIAFVDQAFGTFSGLGNQGSASNELANFQLTIYQPADTGTHQFWQSHSSGITFNGAYAAGHGGGVWADLTAVTGIRIYYTTGTIKSGEVLLYGITSA